jgi:adenosyl cobinamide kinase/adenosyl cobinamide phosphate guanylyltransferase
VKCQIKAVECLTNFVQGLLEEDDREIDETKKKTDVILQYSDSLIAGMEQFLSIGSSKNNESMLAATLDLMNVTAGLIEEKFG